MMVHAKSRTLSCDSLWMFEELVQNFQGDRYFDFEMYQTDIFNRTALRLAWRAGPDAGHTVDTDAAGNLTCRRHYFSCWRQSFVD